MAVQQRRRFTGKNTYLKWNEFLRLKLIETVGIVEGDRKLKQPSSSKGDKWLRIAYLLAPHFKEISHRRMQATEEELQSFKLIFRAQYSDLMSKYRNKPRNYNLFALTDRITDKIKELEKQRRRILLRSREDPGSTAVTQSAKSNSHARSQDLDIQAGVQDAEYNRRRTQVTQAGIQDTEYNRRRTQVTRPESSSGEGARMADDMAHYIQGDVELPQILRGAGQAQQHEVTGVEQQENESQMLLDDELPASEDYHFSLGHRRVYRRVLSSPQLSVIGENRQNFSKVIHAASNQPESSSRQKDTVMSIKKPTYGHEFQKFEVTREVVDHVLATLKESIDTSSSYAQGLLWTFPQPRDIIDMLRKTPRKRENGRNPMGAQTTCPTYQHAYQENQSSRISSEIQASFAEHELQVMKSAKQTTNSVMQLLQEVFENAEIRI